MGRTVLLSLLALACSRLPERQHLLATDAAHGQATASQGLATGFVAFLADDAVYLQPDVDYIRGKAAIRAFLSRAPPTTKLSFRTARARVSADGAVGYTFGWTELSSPGSPVRYGKYIAFWRKQPDGSWQVEAWNRSGGRDSAAAAPAGLPEQDDRPASLRRVDVAAQTRALLGVDSAFAAASLARGAAAAFAEYAALHAVSLGGGKDFVVGRDAIRKDQTPSAPGEVLDWAPAMGGVGPGADLGWTVGDYVFTISGAPPRVFYGKYLTVWEQADSGTWRFVVDGGSGNPAPAGPPGPEAKP